MDKQELHEPDFSGEDLNQNGRPKQKVLFFEMTEEMRNEAVEKLNNEQSQLSEQKYQQAKSNTQKVWDKFYQYHKCNFFKDRTYLEREINPITIFKHLHQQKGVVSNFVELGCGVGNTLFPLLRDYPCFNYYGCDIAPKAINLIEEEMEKHEEYKDRLHVSVCDLAKDEIPYPKIGDLSTLIFVLSAIVPEKHLEVMQKIYDWMKPGSFFYFRDYGRYDFGQLNLASKGNRKVQDNFYMKGDGVCVYYFEKQELEKMCEMVGFKKVRVNLLCKLLQNRKKGLKMYRVWLQGQFYKPPLQPYFQEKIEQMKLIAEKQELQMQKIQEGNEQIMQKQ